MDSPEESTHDALIRRIERLAADLDVDLDEHARFAAGHSLFMANEEPWTSSCWHVCSPLWHVHSPPRLAIIAELWSPTARREDTDEP